MPEPPPPVKSLIIGDYAMKINDTITISPSQIYTIMLGTPEQRADLFLIKTGRKEKPKRTEPMEWGILLEPVVLNYELSRRDSPENIGITQIKLRHPSIDWFYGYADYWWAGKLEGKRSKSKAAIMEVKTTRNSVNVRNAIPRGWSLQIQAMLSMTDDVIGIPITHCDLLCLSQT